MKLINIKKLKPLVETRLVNLYAFPEKNGWKLTAYYRNVSSIENESEFFVLKPVNSKKMRIFKTADSLLKFRDQQLWGECVTFP